MAGKTVGVLALQGAFARHEAILAKLNIPSCQVRSAEDLEKCVGLIIPGGESTTMTFHIKEQGLQTPLKTFAESHPVFGTCAGMILMAGILELLDISVRRNAYGRQCDSFSALLNLSFSEAPFEARFIRAPKIETIDSPSISILAEHASTPVFVQQGNHLAASFHPELTEDLRIHAYFAALCDF